MFINLKNSRIKIRIIIFSIISFLFITAFVFFCTPFISINKAGSGNQSTFTEDGIVHLQLQESLIPLASHYLCVELSATNSGTCENTFTSCLVRWDTGQQDFKINIDGIKHSYYIPLGENRYWVDTEITQEKSSSIFLEFPDMEGLDIAVTKIILKERIAFPLDTFLNRKLLNIAGETGRTVNPFLTPSYILLAVFVILVLIFHLLFRSFYTEKGTNISNLPRKAVFIFILVILFMFSVSFVYSEAIAVKSHWDTYREYIKTGRLDQTYEGFYDFEKFISWLDGKIPEGENLITLVRGEPIYIMSEMAYNLYPRDIKFLNISQESQQDILDEIEKINEDFGVEYTYIITFTEKDLYNIPDLILFDKYREDAGFIYRLK
ncbi:MAG: hypothetical protein JW770_03135 [Actinobacteria bacterium]|nr:hypothetical protein [Actinomycetota bacterium]